MEGERKDKGGEERGEGDYCKRGREGGSGKSRERDEERQESKEERGRKKKEKRSHMITKTYEFACLIPGDAYYITQSVVRENKDSGRKGGEEEGRGERKAR